VLGTYSGVGRIALRSFYSPFNEPDGDCRMTTQPVTLPGQAMNAKTIGYLKCRTAELAIGNSTLRNQGAPRVAFAARQFLAAMNLQCFSVSSEEAYLRVIDRETAKLVQAFPSGARSWGAARKALNIFLRDCVYDRFLSAHFGLCQIHPWLELPLDSYTATGLRKTSCGTHLPPWDAIKRLTQEDSVAYQQVARQVAGHIGCNRVDLDIYLWRGIGIKDLEKV